MNATHDYLWEGFYYNSSMDFYDHNDTQYNYTNHLKDYIEQQFQSINDDRVIFRYCYHVCAGCIVVCNVLLVGSVLVSKKQRHLFWNWLLLNMAMVHILYGAIVCPFQAESLEKRNAGLGVVPCKLIHFANDILDYMSNVSITLLGIYQCLNTMSPRMLKGVSRALMASMMIIIPWVICVMLTAVLRLTMSEEQHGMCYVIKDQVSINLWFTLAYCVPMFFVLLCFLTLVFVSCSSAITTTDASPTGRKNATVFVIICLACCLFLKLPYYGVHFDQLNSPCTNIDILPICYRLQYLFELVKFSSLIIIPLMYLIPSEARRLYRKVRSKPLCTTVDCSANPKQSLRMVKLSSGDKTAV